LTSTVMILAMNFWKDLVDAPIYRGNVQYVPVF